MNVRERFGLIAILDMLGGRGLDLDRSRRRAYAIRDYVDKLDEQVRELESNAPLKSKLSTTVHVLGDMFVFCVTINDQLYEQHDVIVKHPVGGEYFVDKNDPSCLLYLCSGILPWLMSVGIFHNLPLRGAVSIGRFIECNQGRTLLGPAVTDAITWHDQSEWIGLALTKETSTLLDRKKEKYWNDDNGLYISDSYIKYQVPQKDAPTEELYCPVWPKNLINGNSAESPDVFYETPDHAIREFLSQNGYDKLTPSIKVKYDNMLQFYKTVGGKLIESE